MPLLYLESAAVVNDRCLEVALLSVAEAAVVIEVCVVRKEINGTGKVLNSAVELQRSVKGDTAVVVRVRVARLDFEGARVIPNRCFEVLELVVRESTIEERFEVSRRERNRLRVLFYRAREVTLFRSGGR